MHPYMTASPLGIYRKAVALVNKKGTEAKDTFMTIIETAKKSAVTSYQYLRDRISKKLDMISRKFDTY